MPLTILSSLIHQLLLESCGHTILQTRKGLTRNPLHSPSHIPSFVHQSTIPNRAFSCFKWIFSDPDCVKFFPQNPQ